MLLLVELPFVSTAFYIFYFYSFICLLFYKLFVNSNILFLLVSTASLRSYIITYFYSVIELIYFLLHFIIYFVNYENWSLIVVAPINIVALSLAPNTDAESFRNYLSTYLVMLLLLFFIYNICPFNSFIFLWNFTSF